MKELTRPRLIIGTVTLAKVCTFVAPRSRAASMKSGFTSRSAETSIRSVIGM